MYTCRILLAVLSGLAVLFSGSATALDTDGAGSLDLATPDYLQVRELDGKMVAFLDKRKPVEISLGMGEKVLMAGEEGKIGTVVTDRRFLAVSTTSGAWLSEPLEHGEGSSTELMTGLDYTVLVTDERLIGFAAESARFVTYELPLGEEIVDKKPALHLAVFVTQERAIGFSGTSGRFTMVGFNTREEFPEIDISATTALVSTDDTIYIFRASDGGWTRRSRPPGD